MRSIYFEASIAVESGGGGSPPANSRMGMYDVDLKTVTSDPHQHGGYKRNLLSFNYFILLLILSLKSHENNYISTPENIKKKMTLPFIPNKPFSSLRILPSLLKTPQNARSKTFYKAKLILLGLREQEKKSATFSVFQDH